MIALLYGTAYLVIVLLAWACLKGAMHLARARATGETQKVKSLLKAELRIGLILAGLIVIVATHGHGMRAVQVLLIIMMSIGVPENLRVLRGHRGYP